MYRRVERDPCCHWRWSCCGVVWAVLLALIVAIILAAVLLANRVEDVEGNVVLLQAKDMVLMGNVSDLASQDVILLDNITDLFASDVIIYSNLTTLFGSLTRVSALGDLTPGFVTGDIAIDGSNGIVVTSAPSPTPGVASEVLVSINPPTLAPLICSLCNTSLAAAAPLPSGAPAFPPAPTFSNPLLVTPTPTGYEVQSQHHIDVFGNAGPEVWPAPGNGAFNLASGTGITLDTNAGLLTVSAVVTGGIGVPVTINPNVGPTFTGTTQSVTLDPTGNTILAHWCNVFHDDGIADTMVVVEQPILVLRAGSMVWLQFQQTSPASSLTLVASDLTLCRGPGPMANYGGPIPLGPSSCTGQLGGTCTCFNPPLGGTVCQPLTNADIPDPSLTHVWARSNKMTMLYQDQASAILNTAANSVGASFSGIATSPSLMTLTGTINLLDNQPVLGPYQFWYRAASTT